jgi:hypothetical protein
MSRHGISSPTRRRAFPRRLSIQVVAGDHFTLAEEEQLVLVVQAQARFRVGAQHLLPAVVVVDQLGVVRQLLEAFVQIFFEVAKYRTKISKSTGNPEIFRRG